MISLKKTVCIFTSDIVTKTVKTILIQFLAYFSMGIAINLAVFLFAAHPTHSNIAFREVYGGIPLGYRSISREKQADPICETCHYSSIRPIAYQSRPQNLCLRLYSKYQ